MLVFIDESGDPGFKLAEGSSRIFVVAMVIFDDVAAAQSAQATLGEAKRQLGHRGEFKFNKCDYSRRDEFFRAIQPCAFRVRSIVVDKTIIRSENIKSSTSRFYEFFVAQMVKHDNGVLDNAKIVIDGSGEREFRRKLGGRLRREVGPSRLDKVSFRDSKDDLLVQVADMCAGAIARSYRHDRPEPFRWRGLLRDKLSDVWEFR